MLSGPVKIGLAIAGGVVLAGLGLRYMGSRERAGDEALAELRKEVRSMKAEIQIERTRTDSVTRESTARGDSLRAAEQRAAAAEARATALRQLAADRLRQLGPPQTARDSGYAAVVATLQEENRELREANVENSKRLAILTTDRDAWKGLAVRADSIARVRQMALGALEHSIDKSECKIVFGLVKCPSRKTVAFIAGAGGLAVGAVVSAIVVGATD